MSANSKMRAAREALERLQHRSGEIGATTKMLAASDAKRRLYADIQRQRIGKKFTPKMAAATVALVRTYDSMRDRLRETELYESLACDAKFDRFVVTTETLSPKAILGIPGFKASNPKRLWKRDYRFAQRIKGSGSISEIVIESGPTAKWFAPFRIAVIPRDETGLRFQDLSLLLEVLPAAEIKVLEIAWNFPSNCVVDLEYVRRFGLFGRTWMKPGSNPFHDKWGNVGSKIVRAYVKWGTSHFRIELELHVRFLRENGLRDVFDFHKLLPALVPDHILFARLDEAKLVHALRRSGLARDKKMAVLKRAKQKSKNSLWETLRFLRKEAKLKNVRRLLIPIPEANRAVAEALQRLVALWPTLPARLRNKP